MQSKYLYTIILNLFFFQTFAQNVSLDKADWQSIGRENIEWLSNSVKVKDCLIAKKMADLNAYEFSFKAQTPNNEAQVQIWAGFGFQDRDNRYAIGLRGGNNNDLYLCRYQDMAKSKMLALEPLDFDPKVGTWYDLKIVFIEGTIRVYLNDEKLPRIIVKDKAPLAGGGMVLGGGWLQTEYKDVQFRDITNEKATYSDVKDKYIVRLSAAEKEELRKQQRQTYQSIKVKRLKRGRTEISLDGNWLFLPEYEVDKEAPYDLKNKDDNWHLMPVPQFWNPAGNWLHLQDSKLPHRGSGISDNYRELEYTRCRNYTFDFEKTTGAWYRQYIELPKQLKGKQIKLHFDAISKVADVYVNGQYIGGHVGMFGDFTMDISDVVKAGKNLIAVNVKVRKFEKTKDADEHVTRAVSVDINNDMLNSLPHGMFTNTEGGIWQPVKLIITEKVAIEDVYAGTRSDGGDFDITLKNEATINEDIEVKIKITDKKNGATLYTSKKEKVQLAAGTNKVLTIKTGNINPKTWSPHAPNLYTLTTQLYKKGKQIDQQIIDIGFRTFEVKNGQFYLNGNPYWLGGANHPPIGIRSNDYALASKFYGYMHANNQMVTRSHGCPFTRPWMRASDEQGVGVSYEGPFPWFMIGKMPSEELIKIWREETLALVKKYRNHPSLLIWTINNEMYFTMFYHNDPPEIRLKKWKILSDLIKEIRKLSPNTIISADSGYSREAGDYKKNLEPHGIDDGDIDDRHIYLNWYNRDFYQVYNGEWAKRIYWSPGANPDRAFFSQETSTGYTNNDDGHFNRKYLFNNYVPQSWVGDWAYEDKDPAFTSMRHAFMSKELIETIRRTSPETAGLQLFANVTWYRNVYDVNRIEPYPINFSVKKAYQPVLVSAELFGRSFYAGTQTKPRVCIINNHQEGIDLAATDLEWNIMYEGKTLQTGSQAIPVVSHYERYWLDLSLDLPENLPFDKAKCSLVLTLKSNGATISKNDYEILLSTKKWASESSLLATKKIGVFDISGETYELLDYMGISYQKLKDLTQIRLLDLDLLIVANLDKDGEVPYSWEDVRKVMGNGLNTLLIHPGKHAQWLMYDKIQSIYERTGRVVNMHQPEHTTFNDLHPLELAWWQPLEGERPRACRRSYRLKANSGLEELCTYLRPHTGLGGIREETYYEMSGTPLIELKERNGRLIASEMEINRGITDPIAARLMLNMMEALVE